MVAFARIFRRGLSENRARIGLFARAMDVVISSVDIGKITVVLPSGERIEQIGTRPGPSAAINIDRWRAIRRLAIGGDLGFAEAYIDGHWSTPDLEACLELAARNIDVLDGKISGRLAVRLLQRFRHVLRANNKTGSRKNIAYHYDLGNAFYREWLDPSMTHSSALYTKPALSLEEAQRAKIERVKQLMSIEGGEQVLEIGCGWGALAASLGHAGATVDGVTLSSAQLDHATECIRANGLQAAVRLQLKDYRDVTGSYDRIVSIEMLEAVGEAYWPPRTMPRSIQWSLANM